ncbi:MAG TPA: amidohydrolase family protein [Stellaceae bacterium]|jgi:cytosine/adenosine deaminase-related metal-dependent hydrolase
MKRESGKISRRGLIQAGAVVAASVAAPAMPQMADAAESGVVKSGPAKANGRILIKGATILTMDEKLGDIAEGDLLIEGKNIIAVGGALKSPGALVVDGANAIVLPGFVDCHRHAWEGQLRRINPNAATLDAYSAATHLSFARAYRPDDMYAGNLITALGCIDAGITCMIDNSHNSRTAAHSDAAIRALFDSGIRGVHAAGGPQAGDWDHQLPQDLARLQKQFFASPDQLVTLRIFAGPVREQWAHARSLGLRITMEFQGPAMGKIMDQFAAEKLLGPDVTFNHCGNLPESTWQNMKNAGVTIDVCPRSDSQYGLGEGFPAYQHAIDHGMKPGFSVDNETSYSTDMFMEMRTAFHIQRAVATNRKLNGDPNPPAPVSVRDVLTCATVNGAACAGLSDKIGTLTPGKEADLIMIRTDAINLYPSNNALGTVVAAADRGNIDTVIIGGVIRKQHGKLVGVDMARFKKLADDSRAYLFGKLGYKPDIFAESFKI